MTRINCIPVTELHDKHLIAEYRELPRVFALARKSWERGEKPEEDTPSKYTMGKGHVRFFYSKLGYLYHRQVLLIQEMENRGFTPQYKNPFPLVKEMIYITKGEWTKNWVPDEEAMSINRERIQERLRTMK